MTKTINKKILETIEDKIVNLFTYSKKKKPNNLDVKDNTQDNDDYRVECWSRYTQQDRRQTAIDLWISCALMFDV